MEDVKVVELPTRYDYADLPNGASELQPLDFHSPYGCSKGCGDQYVRDYHRIYGLPTVVFRQSCIYGTRQFGVEDQGWVAWFVIAAVTGRPITIYGDGKQVRDILFVEDLLNAYDAAFDHMGEAAGQIFNIGGGRQNTVAIWTEFAPMLERLLGHPLRVSHGEWRRETNLCLFLTLARQPVFGVAAKISAEEGIRRLLTGSARTRNSSRLESCVF